MAFTLKIEEIHGAAFCDDDGLPDDYARGREVSRILRETAQYVEDGGTAKSLLDGNGNIVGGFAYNDPEASDDDEEEASDNGGASISANISIFEQDSQHWLLITGEMFGPYANEDAALDAIPGALRRME